MYMHMYMYMFVYIYNIHVHVCVRMYRVVCVHACNAVITIGGIHHHWIINTIIVTINIIEHQ